jgi:hypothetical protein
LYLSGRKAEAAAAVPAVTRIGDEPVRLLAKVKEMLG